MASSIAATRARFKRKAKALKASQVPAAREAMLKGAAEVARLQKSLVHNLTGRTAKSIQYGLGDPPKGAKLIGGASAGDTSGSTVKVSIWAGDDEAYYVRWEEFGTKPSVKGETVTDAKGRRRKARRTHPGTKPSPFFFPAWRALKRSVKTRISRAASKALKDAARTS